MSQSQRMLSSAPGNMGSLAVLLGFNGAGRACWWSGHGLGADAAEADGHGGGGDADGDDLPGVGAAEGDLLPGDPWNTGPGDSQLWTVLDGLPKPTDQMIGRCIQGPRRTPLSSNATATSPSGATAEG